MQVVDRRLNPKSKSLGNRQRFLRRAKAEIREAIKDSLKSRKVSEAEGSEKVTIRSKSLREPSFSLGRNTGSRDYVLPGNEEYRVGDEIPKPQGGGGGRGSQGVNDGEGQDEFTFTLTKEEFLDLFFDDLKLPNLVKVKLKDLKAPKMARAGFTMDGSPARLNHTRTMRKSLGRRMALRRPSQTEIDQLEAELAAAEAETPVDDAKVAALRAKLEHKQRLRRGIAYIDPIDLQYNRFERVPKPTTQAVMFCLMDASASMTEPLKDLAKRFFMLLHVFLSRYYREVHIVFIRHTSTAAEVDEETFFRSTETGGTVISTALDEMLKVVRERYSPADWNIYAAQASDGDNFHDDMPRCLELLDNEILPLCQYFAYIETAHGERFNDTVETPVWHGYTEIARRRRNFAMRRVAAPEDIFPVFHELFSANGVTRLGEQVRRVTTATQELPKRAGSAAPAVRRAGVELRSDPQGLRRDGRHRAGRTRARHLSQPDRGHHGRADARRLFLDRHAADVPALVVRQALRPRRGLLQARHAHAGLRAGHQLRSLHQLRHGGELHDHAGPGAGACRLRAQPLLQEQLPVPDVDPARPHHRLSGLRQDLCGRVRGALRP